MRLERQLNHIKAVSNEYSVSVLRDVTERTKKVIPVQHCSSSIHVSPRHKAGHHTFAMKSIDQVAQADARIRLQKSVRLKWGSLNANTSSFMVPNVLSGRCFMPS